MHLFNYESKFSQTLIFIGDLCILNLLFIVCCIPVFTIGAAQAALYTAVRVLRDPEDDSSAAKAFLKAFISGFGSITIAHTIFLALEFLMTSILYGMLSVEGFKTWTAVLSLAVLMLFHTQISLFHSRFGCSVGQLFRNSFMLILAHPLRSLLATALVWAPVILALWNFPTFMRATLAWALIYYSIAYLLICFIMNKPFKTLIDHYNQTHDVEGNVILATLDEEDNLVYENSIQDKLDKEAAILAEKEAKWKALEEGDDE